MRSKRLLLLAMSGVRVQNPELRALGLTLPGFVERGKVIASLPSLGLLTLAAWTPPDWEVEYRDLDAFTGAELDALASEDFDLVAISSLTARIHEAYRVADVLRSAGIRVVLGGLHVSVLTDEASAHADAVVVGEGESVWPQLLADADKGRLRPVYRSDHRSHPWDPESAPVPRYDLLDVTRYNRLTLQTTRGCPHHCHFCAASRMISPYRTKPLELVRRELEAIQSHWPRPFLELADDNTFVVREWSHQLVKLLAEYKLRWFTETDISLADDPELLDLLSGSGCAQVLIGLESAERASLHGLDTKNWKYARAESYLEKIARIQSHGITVNGCFTLGLDEDGPEVFERTRDFVRASGLAEVQITVLTPFPGTDLYREMLSSGRLLKSVFWDQCTLFDVVYQPRKMSVDDLEQGFRWLMAELYNDQATGERRRQFRTIVQRQRELSGSANAPSPPSGDPS